MKVLVTGATGYVGSRIVSRLAAQGDRVVGAVRHAGRTSALPKGVEPLIGDLANADLFVSAAKGVDAVIHTGFASHGRDWFAAVEVERVLVAALAEALAGTGKRLIVSNGTGFLGDAGGRFLDETATTPDDNPAKVRAEATAAATRTPQLHGIELRLASYVHGHAGSVFLPILVASARRTGRSLYIDEGHNRLSAVHVEAAAEAYLSALANGDAGETYFIAADDAPTMRDLAEAIAIGTGAKAMSVTAAEAATVLDPFTAMFMKLDNGLSSRKARCKLGWSPAGWPTLLWDVAHGSYALGQNVHGS